MVAVKTTLAVSVGVASALRFVPVMTTPENPLRVADSHRAMLLGGASSMVATIAGAYVLPDLPYPYEALEPSIDAATMKVKPNYLRHLLAYIRADSPRQTSCNLYCRHQRRARRQGSATNC